MPDLRTRGRRGFDRLAAMRQGPPPAPPASPGRNRLLVAGAALLVLLTSGVFVGTVVEDLDTSGSVVPMVVPNRSAGRTGTTTRSGGGSWSFSWGPRASTAVATTADLEAFRLATAAAVQALPLVAKEATAPATFRDRFELFKKLYLSLPERDRLALFPRVDLAELERFHGQDPGQACKLLDAFFRRFRMLVP